MLLFFTLFSFSAFAATPKCSEVALTGDADWAPYVVRDGDNYSGVALELARKIFKELDLKTSFVPMYSRNRIANALRHGDIAVLVSTYDFENSSETLDLIQPGYIVDPLKIAILNQHADKIVRWQDLTGLEGLMSLNAQFDSDFTKFSSKHLYIRPFGNINKIVDLILKGKTDYLIGSDRQLKYWLHQLYSEDDVIKIIDNFARSSKIHMAMSKKSACYSYMPYVKKRLLELQQDGTVAKLMAQYLPHDPVIEPTVVTDDDIDLLMNDKNLVEVDDEEIFLDEDLDVDDAFIDEDPKALDDKMTYKESSV